MASQNHDLSNILSSYLKGEKYDNIRDFYKKLVFALEVNLGVDNFFLIISGDDLDIDLQEAYLKFADYLSDNYSEENIQRTRAYYWVSLDYNRLLLRSDGDETVRVLRKLKEEKERLGAGYTERSAETAWLEIVAREADALMPLLMKGENGVNFNHSFNLSDKAPDPLPCFYDFARYALCQILRFRSLRIN
ncbi:hypothetical protein [Halomonas sp. 25-S5]|uniref:hypothetical protein n=1 Tax=Halomonas sp. 25-S5 TaxID=2994065 RepID=UPI00246870A9|nr:hypothetical protein [Halomonas sp. 25-S5]